MPLERDRLFRKVSGSLKKFLSEFKFEEVSLINPYTLPLCIYFTHEEGLISDTTYQVIAYEIDTVKTSKAVP